MLILWGDAGAGKSTDAREFDSDRFHKPRNRWWDGYFGQRTVIIDDFYGWLPIDELLRMVDRAPYRVEFKGGSVEFLSKWLIITSNHHWTEWWPNSLRGPLVDAFARRIHGILRYTGQYPDNSVELIKDKFQTIF